MTLSAEILSVLHTCFASPQAAKGAVADFFVSQWHQHPHHIVIELLFIVIFLYFWFVPLHKARQPRPVDPPTTKEREEMLHNFRSQPFETTVPASTHTDKALTGLVVKRREGVHAEVFDPVAGEEATRCLCVDLASFDHHNLSLHKDVKAVAKTAIVTYGVGSCGPRGFYGTIKPHLDAEADLATFLGVDKTIIFSFNFATISTAMPAFATRGDTLLVDELCSLPSQQGAALSRSSVQYYRHNDLLQLEELMILANQRDRKQRNTNGRRFVVTEGVFRNNGDLCPLPHIIALCKRHKFRLMLDDSYGFAALGATGRGTPEHFGVPMDDIALYVGSLGNGLGAIGGFCAGKKGIIDYMALACTGYIFSASLPPYMTAAASAAILLLRDATYGKRLLAVSAAFRKEVRKHRLNGVAMVAADGDASPIVHFKPTSAELLANDAATNALFDRCVRDLFARQILVSRCVYNHEERVRVVPSLRLVLKSDLPPAEATNLAKVIVTVLRNVF